VAGACFVWAIAMRECSMRAAVRTDGVMCSMPAGLGCHYFLFLFDDHKEAEEDKFVKCDVTKYSISIFSSFFAYRNSPYTEGV